MQPLLWVKIDQTLALFVEIRLSVVLLLQLKNFTYVIQKTTVTQVRESGFNGCKDFAMDLKNI